MQSTQLRLQDTDIVCQASPCDHTMSDMQLFTQDIGGRNVAITAIMVGNAPWFRGTDVALALSYKSPQKTVRDHVDEQDRRALDSLRLTDSVTPLERNEAAQIFISESGVYSLIMRSNKKEATLFQRWVTNDVLPTIRRTGQYTAPTQQPQLEAGSQGSVAGPTPYELEMLRGARMQSLTAAFNAAQAIGSSSKVRVEHAVQKAIDDALLPQGAAPDQYVDAEQILKERGHTPQQVARLAGELGRDLKLVAENEERAPQGREMEFGHEKKQIGLYHRVHDAPMVETVLASFKARELYTRVLSGQPDPVRAKREGLLQTKGRGRSRSERRTQ